MYLNNRLLQKINSNFDKVIYSGNSDEIRRCYNLSLKLVDKSNSYILKSCFYYCAYNCYTRISNGSDSDYSQRIFLMRMALKMYDNFIQSNDSKEDEGYVIGHYINLKVNMSIALDESGRIISAIKTLRDIDKYDYVMADANLGSYLFEYSQFSNNEIDTHYLRYRSILPLENVFNSDDRLISFYHLNGFIDKWSSTLSLLISHKDHLKKIGCKHHSDYKIKIDEEEYRKWVAYNTLALNFSNDIDDNINYSYDTVMLGRILIKSNYKDSYINNISKIFNSIKQEYVSARFQLYQGINNEDYSYSDTNNHLYDNNDYTLYAFSIEQIKNAYRAIYSILDRIGLFINYYFDLKINIRGISFNSALRKISESNINIQNYGLRGLLSIRTDLYHQYNKESNYANDPKMEDIKELRDYMEHRLIRITTDMVNKKKTDLEFTISINEITSDSIYLIQKCREAIMMLIIMVKINEDQKFQIIEEKGEYIPSFFVNEYNDSFKTKDL